MIPHHSTRPIPEDGNLKAWDPDCELVINIKSQGQWACYRAHKHYCDALMREGMVAFQGRADEWGEAVPRLPTSSIDYRNGIVLDEDVQVTGAPGSYGVMVIDYDAKKAMSIQAYSYAFAVPQHLDKWHRQKDTGGEDDDRQKKPLPELAGVLGAPRAPDTRRIRRPTIPIEHRRAGLGGHHGPDDRAGP